MATTLHTATNPSESIENGRVRLLVSVRDLSEADIAIRCRIDWLDIKDPSLGPLGRPQIAKALEIERVANERAPDLLVSVALGEACETTLDELVFYTQCFRKETRFKLAFSGRKSANTSDVYSFADTERAFDLFRELSMRLVPGRLIPVFYADRSFAYSPAWEALLRLAIESSSGRVLIDTFRKDGRSLLDHLTVDELTEMIRFAADHGISVAIAGSIQKPSIPRLLAIGADVIGVRGAACKGQKRTESVDPTTLQELFAIFQS